MSPPSTSNIRAYVQWREPAVYAGEEIECIITFRNVASVPKSPGNSEEELQTPIANGSTVHHAAAGSRRTSVVQTSRAPSVASTRGGRGHRPALSLNVVSAPSRGGLHSAGLQPKTPGSAVHSTRGHGRSLSIISLNSDAPSDGRLQAGGKRAAKGHGRSASLQYVPKALPSQAGVGLGIGSPRQPSPLYESTTPPALAEEPMALRPGRKRPGTVSAGNTPQLGRREGSQDETFKPDFKFPAQPIVPKAPSPSNNERPKLPRSPSTMHSAQHRPISPRPPAPEGWSGAISNLNPISRVISDSSVGGTSRNSSEFYTLSNHSDETLTSEAPPHANQANGRLLPKPSHSRQASRSPQSSHSPPAEPETLMMGYARTVGNFTLDGALVNAAPFEEVKRKGVQSGGGVVGLERSKKRSSGMFGAFGWGNLGESLGGLLGGDDMSSMAQMKASAGSKSIPLLNTPQSLLFVDLRLAPGESRSYSYCFNLPRGLPPSHRGRAIKVNYHLLLGIQRPGGQAVKHIEVPFRVLGSYNSRGETLGHDLMSPYILLQDGARTKSVSPSSTSSPFPTPPFTAKEAQNTGSKTPKQGLEDFLRYTERLLDQASSEDGNNGTLLSPTSPAEPLTPLSRKESLPDQPPGSIKEAIDLALLRSNHATTAESQSANRFNIARSGQPVAVLTLLRPAYRLGEAVIGTLDFTAPSAPTYAVLVELETEEKVDPSLALRSGSSIHRVTRKIHAVARENALFARRVGFSLTIPASATPGFETTGVSLVWKLRVEFTVQRQLPQTPRLELDGQTMSADRNPEMELLEELGTDERGTAMIARERLLGETFEIAVPIRIFGAPGVEGSGGEREGLEV